MTDNEDNEYYDLVELPQQNYRCCFLEPLVWILNENASSPKEAWRQAKERMDPIFRSLAKQFDDYRSLESGEFWIEDEDGEEIEVSYDFDDLD